MADTLTRIQVSGTYQDPNRPDFPVEGKIIQFIPNAKRILNAAGATVCVPQTLNVELDSNGSFSVPLIATNDPDGTPIGWTYTVKEPFGTNPYPILVPFDSPGLAVNLVDIAPAAAESGGTVQLVGGIGIVGVSLSSDETALVFDMSDGSSQTSPSLPYATSTALTTGLSGKASTASVAAKADTSFVEDAFAQWAPDATGTDDTVNLNGILSASAGQQVRFKPGQVYKVSDSLTVPSATKLDLTGAEIQQLTNNKVTFNLSSVSDVTLRGGKITGKNTDYTSGGSPVSFGVTVTGSTDVIIENCFFTGHAGAGVKVDSTSVGVTITGCRIKGTGSPSITAGDGTQSCIRLDGGSSDITISDNNLSDACQGIIAGNTVTDLTIANNRIHDMVGQHGMYIQGGNGLVIVNNRIRTVNITGIKVQMDNTSAADSAGVVVSNNSIDGAGVGTNGVGILIVNIDTAIAHFFRDLTVVGNTIRNSAGIGMQIADVRAGVVSSNTVGVSAVDGMRIYNCQGVTVESNVVHDTQQIGINFLAKTNSAMARVMLRGNQVRDAAIAGTTNLNYGVKIFDGSDLTLDSNFVTASHVNMIYGIYFAGGDQTTAIFRDNYVANANAYGMRLIAATNVREFRNNNVFGTTGAILNPPPNVNLNPPAVSADVQTFASAGSFTWTMPAGAVIVRAEVIGGGGGGGSGRRGAAASVRCGGGGASGACRSDALINATDLSSTMTVVVGAGGAGGVAQGTNDTNGNAGSNGSDSTFGNSTTGIQVYARGGVAGSGGSATNGLAGVSVAGMFPGGGGGIASTTGGTGGTAAIGACGGGGGGGGVTSADASSAGGTGQASNFSNTRSSTAGGTVGAGQNGTAGNAAAAAGIGGDGGGGGAGSITAAAGTGGAGGIYGGGGAGGGASLNGNNSGAGGAGAAGFIRVTTYF